MSNLVASMSRVKNVDSVDGGCQESLPCAVHTMAFHSAKRSPHGRWLLALLRVLRSQSVI